MRKWPKPVEMSAREVGSILQPMGEACGQREDQQVQELLAQGAQKHRSLAERQEEHAEPIRRLSVDMDGVMACVRRGRVPLEPSERERSGDVSRDINVGGSQDRSGQWLGARQRRTAVALAQRTGMCQATQVVILAEEPFPGAIQIVDAEHARQPVWEVA